MERRRKDFGEPERQTSGSLVFAIFGVVGCAYIVLAKTYEIPAMAVTLVPIGLMLAYAALVSLVRRLKLREDQTGDNLYYMGFTYTLTSLGVSLYQYSSDGAVDEIVRNFGIAVGSTIAGVVLRVFFHQMRRDPVEIEETSRMELAEASRKVRREIEDAILEFSNFRRTAQQGLGEMMEEIAKGVEASTRTLTTALETQAREMLHPVANASLSAASAIEKNALIVSSATERTDQALQKSLDDIERSAASISERLRELVRSLRDAQAPDEIIRLSVEPLTRDLAVIAHGLKSTMDRQERVVANALARRSDAVTPDVRTPVTSNEGRVDEESVRLEPRFERESKAGFSAR